jgi:hypothetical protein
MYARATIMQFLSNLSSRLLCTLILWQNTSTALLIQAASTCSAKLNVALLPSVCTHYTAALVAAASGLKQGQYCWCTLIVAAILRSAAALITSGSASSSGAMSFVATAALLLALLEAAASASLLLLLLLLQLSSS